MQLYELKITIINCVACPFFKLTNLQIAYCGYTNKELYIIDLEKDEDEELSNFKSVVTWENGKPSFCPAQEVINANYDEY